MRPGKGCLPVMMPDGSWYETRRFPGYYHPTAAGEAPMGYLIRRKRIYEAAAEDDGLRVLVERLWPRGMSKADSAVDIWLKEIAPSTDLRRWFGHEPSRWEAFVQRYRGELDANQEPVSHLLGLASSQDITLVYAARETPGNSARVLQAYLLERLGNP